MARMAAMTDAGRVRCDSHVPASLTNLARSPGSLLAPAHTNLNICVRQTGKRRCQFTTSILTKGADINTRRRPEQLYELEGRKCTSNQLSSGQQN
eukprot:scaffold199677_cov19-Tisochrysis_lutea.AAC.1